MERGRGKERGEAEMGRREERRKWEGGRRGGNGKEGGRRGGGRSRRGGKEEGKEGAEEGGRREQTRGKEGAEEGTIRRSMEKGSKGWERLQSLQVLVQPHLYSRTVNLLTSNLISFGRGFSENVSTWPPLPPTQRVRDRGQNSTNLMASLGSSSKGSYELTLR